MLARSLGVGWFCCRAPRLWSFVNLYLQRFWMIRLFLWIIVHTTVDLSNENDLCSNTVCCSRIFSISFLGNHFYQSLVECLAFSWLLFVEVVQRWAASTLVSFAYLFQRFSCNISHLMMSKGDKTSFSHLMMSKGEKTSFSHLMMSKGEKTFQYNLFHSLTLFSIIFIVMIFTQWTCTFLYIFSQFQCNYCTFTSGFSLT